MTLTYRTLAGTGRAAERKPRGRPTANALNYFHAPYEKQNFLMTPTTHFPILLSFF